MTKPKQRNVVELGIIGPYIGAKGIAKLHAMVTYARAAMAEMTTEQPTVVKVLRATDRSTGMPLGNLEWQQELQDRSGISVSMLERFEAAHDWENAHKLSHENKPENTRRVNSLKVDGVDYHVIRIRNALDIVKAFAGLLRRAAHTLGLGTGSFSWTGGGEYDPAHVGYRKNPKSSAEKLELETVTQVPPQKYEELERALIRYDETFPKKRRLIEKARWKYDPLAEVRK
jgi:hypothetical protein